MSWRIIATIKRTSSALVVEWRIVTQQTQQQTSAVIEALSAHYASVVHRSQRQSELSRD